MQTCKQEGKSNPLKNYTGTFPNMRGKGEETLPTRASGKGELSPLAGVSSCNLPYSTGMHVLGLCLARALASGPTAFCRQGANSHFCYVILKQVTMETGMKMAIDQRDRDGKYQGHRVGGLKLLRPGTGLSMPIKFSSILPQQQPIKEGLMD